MNPDGTVHRRLTYMPAMEGMRGFSMLLEMATHLGIFVVATLHWLLVPGAVIYMSIFFVLSGYFITVILLQDFDQHGRIRLWHFWRGRARRLYPPLLVLLAAHWLLTLHYDRSISAEWRDTLWALTNTMDYRYAVTGDPALGRSEMIILWSVGVEIKFYLLWPFVVTGLVRYVKRLGAIIGVLAAVAVVSNAVRILEYRAWDDWLAVYYRFEGRVDAFAIGAILGFLWYHGREPRRLIERLAWPCWIFFIACSWLVTLQSGVLNSWGFFVFNVAAVVIVGASLDADRLISRWLANRFFVLIGRMSFSFYLIHIQVYMWIVTERRYLPMWQQVGLALGCTAVFGTLFYLVAERPTRRQRGGKVSAGPPVRVAADAMSSAKSTST